MTLTKTLDTGTNEGAETVTFYHISREVNAFKSLFREGAKAIGKGLGGQQDGFYVWNKKEPAISHFSDFLQKKPTGDGLLIGIEVNKDSLTYPNWQFDLEFSKELSPLLFKYKDKIAQIENLEYKTAKGEKEIIPSISISKRATEENCLLKFSYSTGSTCLAIGDDNGVQAVDIFQALIDKMCKNPEFKQDYDKLLQESISSSQRLALKYTGIEPLIISKADHLEVNADHSVKTTPIFDASKGKKQICPFLKLELARTRKEK